MVCLAGIGIVDFGAGLGLEVILIDDLELVSRLFPVFISFVLRIRVEPPAETRARGIDA